MKVGTALILFLFGAAFAVQDDASSMPAVRGTAHPVISAPGAMPANDYEAREQERKVQAWYLQQQMPVQVPVESRIIHEIVNEPGGVLMNDGPDVVIDAGYVAATAADYEMDGTMWVAVSAFRDSAVWVYKSTNHGVSWSLVSRFYRSTPYLFTQLQLVVGQAESAFVFCYFIMPDNNGDLWQARFKRDGSSFWARPILAGPDTINRVIVCRDYYYDYWLYACAGDVDATPEFDDFMMRSTDFGKTWAVLNTFRFVSAGSYSAGAGKYLYLAGCPSLVAPGQMNLLVNTSFGNPDSWYETSVRPDTFDVRYPIIGAAFTRPESTAVIWTVYSHNYRNSGDWDVKYVYSTDRGRTWSSSYYLAGSSAADEHYADLKNYTSLGNDYMNASYISEQGYRTVYRHWVSASNPTGWSDTLRINTNSAGTGEQIKPLLVYSPGASGTGAGCAFVGAALYRCYWNAPWTVGIAEERVVPKGKTTAAFVFPNPASRTVRFVSPIRGDVRVAVYDALGRLVYSLSDAGGDNVVWNLVNRDGERVSPGVYFVRLTGAEAEFTEQLVVE